MSVRTELDELTKWISDLKAVPSPGTGQPKWRPISNTLKRSSDRLRDLRGSLPGGLADVAELAADLGNNAEALALRADLFAERATRVPDTRPDSDAEAGRRQSPNWVD